MNDRKLYIDFLAVISTLAVVFLHANTVFWSHPSGTLWVSANLIETLFYFAVPIFFMISGVGLMNYRERYSTKIFFSKRLKKVCIPFLFWAFFSVLVGKGWHLSDITLKDLYDAVVNNKFMSIYWFFFPLFAIYLSMPVISLLAGKICIFKYMVVYATISYFILPFLSTFWGIQVNYSIQSPVTGGFLLYPILGYYLSQVEISYKHRIVIYLMGFLGFLAHLLGTIYLSEPNGNINMLFKGYLNWPCLLQSVAVFIFFKNLNYSYIAQSEFLMKLLSIFRSGGLGVYLIHFYVLQIIWNKLHVPTDSIIFRTVGAVMVFVFCSLLVFYCRKFKIGRLLFP